MRDIRENDRVRLRDGRKGAVMWPANFKHPATAYPARDFYDGRARARMVGYRVRLDGGGHCLVPEGAMELLEDIA